MERVDTLREASGDKPPTGRRRLHAPRRLAIGDGDQLHPMALPAHQPQQRPGPEDLVIGVWGDQDDRIDRMPRTHFDALCSGFVARVEGAFTAGVTVVVALGGLVAGVGVAVAAGVAVVVGFRRLACDVVVVEVAHGDALPTAAVSEP